MFGYLGEPYQALMQLPRLLAVSDIAAYGQRKISRPHPSNRRKRGGRGKAQRRAKGKRLRRHR